MSSDTNIQNNSSIFYILRYIIKEIFKIQFFLWLILLLVALFIKLLSHNFTKLVT